jgi:hypothetical protein
MVKSVIIVIVVIQALVTLTAGCSNPRLSPEEQAAQAFLRGEGRPLIEFHDVTAQLAGLDPKTPDETVLKVCRETLDAATARHLPGPADLTQLLSRVPEGPAHQALFQELKWTLALLKYYEFALPSNGIARPEQPVSYYISETKKSHDVVEDIVGRYGLR